MRMTILLLSSGLLALSVPGAIAQTQEPPIGQAESEAQAASDLSESQLSDMISREIRREVRQAIRQEMRAHMRQQPHSPRRGPQGMMEQPSQMVPAEQANGNEGVLLSLFNSRIARLRGLALQTGFVLLDADGDGSISLEEAQAFTERMFKLVDTNDDGHLSIEELEIFVRGKAPEQQ